MLFKSSEERFTKTTKVFKKGGRGRLGLMSQEYSKAN